MSGSEQAQALLAGATPDEWRVYGPTLEGDFWIYAPRVPRPNEHFVEDEEPINLICERVGKGDAALIAAAPGLIADLLSENAALAAEVARLQAQAGAVAGLREVMWCWSDEAERMRAGVPEEFAHRNARHFHALGRAGALDDCATAIERALAQASAEGEAGAEGVGG